MMSERGFTLMEVLVALVLLTIFTVVAYRALNAVLDARHVITSYSIHYTKLYEAVMGPTPAVA